MENKKRITYTITEGYSIQREMVSLPRIWQSLREENRCMAIISPNNDEISDPREITRRRKKMEFILKENLLSYYRITGGFQETENPKTILMILFRKETADEVRELLLNLMEEYNQELILWKIDQNINYLDKNNTIKHEEKFNSEKIEQQISKLYQKSTFSFENTEIIQRLYRITDIYPSPSEMRNRIYAKKSL